LKFYVSTADNLGRRQPSRLNSSASTYGSTSINMMPTVNAIMAPMTMALDAIPVQRIAAVMMETAAVAAMSAAGAITHGISCVNYARVCMLTPFQLPCNERLLKILHD